MSDGKKIGIAVGVGIGVFALVGVILAIVMAVMGPGVLGGVGLNNNGQTTGGEGEGGGGAAILDDAISNLTYSYKAAYRTENVGSQIVELTDSLSENILDGLVAGYGSGKAVGSDLYIAGQKIIDSNVDPLAYYVDSIRYIPFLQAYEYALPSGNNVIANDSENSRWLWTFNKYTESEYDALLKIPIEQYTFLSAQTITNSVRNYYTQILDFEVYSSRYQELYHSAMQLILIEIAAGENDLSSVITIENATAESGPVIYYHGNIITEENYISEILPNAVAKFDQSGDYFGFGDDDKDLIASYILDSIIGPAATQDNLNENRNYQAYVTDLVDSLIDNSQPPSSTNFAAYPRTSFVDTGVLALDIENAEPFHDIVSFEYQSIIIMPDDLDENEPLEVGGFEMTFESSRDMTIKMFVRFFDKSSGTITTTAPVSYDIDGGTVDLDTLENTNDEDLLFDNGYYDMFAFDNNEIVKADSVKVVDTGSDQQAYKMLTADDGSTVTVFNEAYATSDFWEIVFQVEKDPLDPPETDYSFKVAVYNVNLKD